MARGGLPLDGEARAARFGVGLDERVVEMPLALAAAALDRPGDVLDAGSALNLPLVRAIAGQPRARVTHLTLPGSKEPMLPGDEDRFVHAFGDLRTLPFRDHAFARVVCVSTLEHVAMDTTRFGARDPAGRRCGRRRGRAAPRAGARRHAAHDRALRPRGRSRLVPHLRSSRAANGCCSRWPTRRRRCGSSTTTAAGPRATTRRRRRPSTRRFSRTSSRASPS